MDLLGIEAYDVLQESRKGWGEESLRNANNVRESKWTQGIAVGSEAFVEKTKKELGIRAKGRNVIETEGECQLREPVASYSDGFAPKTVF